MWRGARPALMFPPPAARSREQDLVMIFGTAAARQWVACNLVANTFARHDASRQALVTADGANRFFLLRVPVAERKNMGTQKFTDK